MRKINSTGKFSIDKNNIKFFEKGISNQQGNAKLEVEFSTTELQQYSKHRIYLSTSDCGDNQSKTPEKKVDIELSLKYTFHGEEYYCVFEDKIVKCKEKIGAIKFGGQGLLLPPTKYRMSISIKNLLANQEFTIAYDLIGDFSEKATLVNKTLNEAKTDLIANPICFAISDHLINYCIAQSYRELQNKTSTTINGIVYSISSPALMKWNRSKYSILSQIDEDGEIHLKTIIQIDLSLETNIDNPFLTLQTIFDVVVTPFITQSTDSFLELHFLNAELSEIKNKEVLNSNEYNQVFQTEQQFEEEKDKLTSEIASGNEKTEFGKVFPAILTRISLPSNWGTMEKIRVEFQKFYFKTGIINGERAGYILPVFSIYNIAGCHILTSTEDNIKVKDESPSTSTGCELRNFHNKLGIGMSQDALNEILKIFSSNIISDSYTKGGDLKYSVKYWVKVGFKNLKISKDSLIVELDDLEAAGSISARYKIGQVGIWRGSATLKFKFNNVDANLSFINPNGDSIELAANIDIGNMDVIVEVHTKVIIDLAAKIQANFKVETLESLINLLLRLMLFKEELTVHDRTSKIRYLDTVWFPNESVVLQPQLIFD